MKVCSKCQQLGTFYKDKNGADGYRSICRECDIKRAQIWNKSNANSHTLHERKWNSLNKEIAIYRRNLPNRKLKRNATTKQWIENNPDRMRKLYKDMYKRRYKVDPIYTMRRITSNSLKNAIKRHGYKKSSKTASILGCSWNEFKIYLEAKFQLDMTWQNHGEWELDHIIPCLTANSEETLLKLQHYTNLQPLWKQDHMIKTVFDMKALYK